ncbi:MAG: Ig-like domain-containing protein [Pseudomonadota bacterium]|nr:Ig-like domain-containing protein [Pseudomonadota bacterium]
MLAGAIALLSRPAGGDEPPPPDIIGVRVEPPSGSLQAGAFQELQAICLLPEDLDVDCTSDPKTHWMSSNSSVATISPSGRLTAISPGVVTIQASQGGFTGSSTWTITAVPPPTVATLELGPPITRMMDAVPETFTLNYTASPLGGAKVWSLVSGPALPSFVDTGPTSVRFQFSVGGAYEIRLTYTVPGLSPVSDTVRVQINVPPVTPFLELGPLQVVQQNAQGTAILLLDYETNATGAKTWTLLSGPPLVRVADTGPSEAILEFNAAANYKVRLTIFVDDTSGNTVTDTLDITVLGSDVPPPPPPPPPDARVITGNQPNGFTVPAGENWLIQGHLTTPKSVIVYGKLWARKGAWLEFTGVDNRNFVGGAFFPATDIGLWVQEGGQLDFRGTYKEPWGYGMTSHPSWLPTDELVEGPLFHTEINRDTGFRPYVRNTTPRMMPDGRRLPVFNFSRDVKISGQPGISIVPNEPGLYPIRTSGMAHIRFAGTRPQFMEDVEISYMGPLRMGGADGKNNVGVLGRYGLHFHMMGDGSRGSIMNRLVVKHTGSWAIVPHMSNGMSFKKCITYDTERGAYTWDALTNTVDLLYEDCVGAWVHELPTFRGRRIAAFNHQTGFNMTARRCLGVGVLGGDGAAGFVWPEIGIRFPTPWNFEDNTALACKMWGAFTWQNNNKDHRVPTAGRFTIINCGAGGIEHGAYTNNYDYSHTTIYNNAAESVALRMHALSTTSFNGNRYQRLIVRGGKHAIEIPRHSLPGGQPVLVKDWDIQGVTGKKVYLHDFGVVTGSETDPRPTFLDIVNCGITPADFKFADKIMPGQKLRLQQGNQAWRLNDNKTFTPVALFDP